MICIARPSVPDVECDEDKALWTPDGHIRLSDCGSIAEKELVSALLQGYVPNIGQGVGR